jgi:mannose-6-phosphate isomerase-like protein (cupin superfamily)
MHVAQLAGNAIGSAGDNFVIVEWTVEVGDHWIAPLHVHHEDDEAWYVLSGSVSATRTRRRTFPEGIT